MKKEVKRARREYKEYLSRVASRRGELTYEYNGHTYRTYEYAAVYSNRAKRSKFIKRQMKRAVNKVEWYDEQILSRTQFEAQLNYEKKALKTLNMSTSNAIANVVNYQEYGASRRQAIATKIMLKETGQESLLANYSKGLKGVKELIAQDRALREDTGKGIIDYAALKEYYRSMIENGISSKKAKENIAQEYFGS